MAGSGYVNTPQYLKREFNDVGSGYDVPPQKRMMGSQPAGYEDRSGMNRPSYAGDMGYQPSQPPQALAPQVGYGDRGMAPGRPPYAGGPDMSYQTSQASAYNRPQTQDQPSVHDQPSFVLMFNITNPKYPITVDVMHAICASDNRVVNRLMIFRKNGVQALVEFDSVAMAEKAREALNGADIYSGCCTLNIDFAKPLKLAVVKNDSDTRDYTNPNLGKEAPAQKIVGLLPEPGTRIGQPGNGHPGYANDPSRAEPQPGYIEPRAGGPVDSRPAAMAPRGEYMEPRGYAEPRTGYMDSRGVAMEPRSGYMEPIGVPMEPRGASMEPRGAYGEPQRGGYLEQRNALPGNDYMEPRAGQIDGRGGYMEPRGAGVEPRGQYMEPRGGYMEPRGGSMEPRGGYMEPRSGEPRGMEPRYAEPPRGGYMETRVGPMEPPRRNYMEQRGGPMEPRGGGLMEPPRSGYMEPRGGPMEQQRGGYMEPPRGGPMEPNRGGPMEPPRGGPMEPNRGGPVEPPRGGYMEPRGGSMEPPRRGYMEPRGGSVEPPRGGPMESTRGGPMEPRGGYMEPRGGYIEPRGGPMEPPRGGPHGEFRGDAYNGRYGPPAGHGPGGPAYGPESILGEPPRANAQRPQQPPWNPYNDKFGGGSGRLPPPPRPHDMEMGNKPPSIKQDGQKDGGAGGNTQGCVLMVYGLNKDKINCQRLFNLFCLYGNVVRIMFLKKNDEVAMIQMGDQASCNRAIQNLDGCKLFGNQLSLSFSKQPFISDQRKPRELQDGSSSCVDFMGNHNNRFSTPEATKRNRVIPPTRCLYAYNIPNGCTEEELNNIFSLAGPDIKPPIHIKILPSNNDQSCTAIAVWTCKEDSTDALVVVNHTPIEKSGEKYSRSMKLCFTGRD